MKDFNFSQEDLNLRLLSGEPIEIESVGFLYPLTLKQISKMGLTNYYKFLNALCFRLEDLDLDVTKENNDISQYEIIVSNSMRNSSYRDFILMSLALFFNENVYFYCDDILAFFYIGSLTEGRIIDKLKYEKIKHILELQNNIKDNEKEENSNPDDDRVKEALEKLKKAKEKVNKAKRNNNEDYLTLSDLVSILSANGNNLNIINVWDLNMYQFNNQFTRMQMIEEYDINIRSILAGADKKDIELKHWMSKI